MRTIRIPEEVFIVSRPDAEEDGHDKTPVGMRPFYDRQEAELAAARMDRTLEVIGYHLVRTVTLG